MKQNQPSLRTRNRCLKTTNIQKEPLDGDKSIGGLADYSEEPQSRIPEDLDLQLARSLQILKMKEAEKAKTVEDSIRSKATN